MWWAADVNESFHRSVAQDPQVNKSLEELSTAVTSNLYFSVLCILPLYLNTVCCQSKEFFICKKVQSGAQPVYNGLAEAELTGLCWWAAVQCRGILIR